MLEIVIIELQMYWIVQNSNSWGDLWGDLWGMQMQGFFYIVRGTDECHIEDYGFTATF
jgi:hypothetical protein